MKSKKNACLQQTGNRPVDSRTTVAFRQLRLQAEDLTLELGVRLRVLGKTMHSACPEQGTVLDPSAYKELRKQLDRFFASVARRKFPEDCHIHHIQSYLQDALPSELGEAVCGEPCPIELVETVISLLTESIFEEEPLAESLVISCSF